MSQLPTSTIINVDTLQKLKNLQKPGRPDLLAALIHLYLETAAENVGQIRNSFKNKDLNAFTMAAHSLKSSSANLGALDFAKQCAEIEASGEADLTSIQLEEKVNKLEKNFLTVYQELRGFIIVS